MRKSILIYILVFFVGIIHIVSAQSYIPFQGIALDKDGKAVDTKKINIKISLLAESATGKGIYSESHSQLTDNFGLFQISIGGGKAISGSFASIDWAKWNYFLKVDMDINGGSNYVQVSVIQLGVVPYAFNAKTGGIGTENPDSSAIFDLKSNSKGILLPRLSEKQRNQINKPAESLIVYQTDALKGIYIYQNKTWNMLKIASTDTTKVNQDVPPGNQKGDILFFNGENWVILPSGKPGQFLRVGDESMPGWHGQAYNNAKLAIRVKSVSTNSVEVEGEVLTNGGANIMERGFVYDVTSTKNSERSFLDCIGCTPPDMTSLYQGTKRISLGNGTSTFNTKIVGLFPNSKYYLRSFAKNAYGAAVSQEFIIQTNPLSGIDANGLDSMKREIYATIEGNHGGWNGFSWDPSNLPIGSIMAQEVYKSGGFEMADWQRFQTYSLVPGDALISYKWGKTFKSINLINDVIRINQSNNSISSADKIKNIAEMRFMRAYFHFIAKRLWNNIPYYDETSTYGYSQIDNRTDVYAKIEADLQFAIANLPNEILTDKSILNTMVARFLLGKVYVYQKKWAEAKTILKGVFDSNKYQLLDKFSESIHPLNMNNNENIWAPKFTPDRVKIRATNFIGKGPLGSNYFMQPSLNLANAYQTDAKGLPLFTTYNNTPLANDFSLKSTDNFTLDEKVALDPRIDRTIGRRGVPYFDWGLHPGSDWSINSSRGGTFAAKKYGIGRAEWLNLKTKDTLITGKALFKYSDLILMLAEAEVNAGSSETARTLVNLIRKRASNPNDFVYKYKDNSKPENGFSTVKAANYQIKLYEPADWSNARAAIQFERKLELALDGERFYDITRSGDTFEINNNINSDKTITAGGISVFYSVKNSYLPIPQSAIVANPLLVQNPGY
jgi:hypothetical protein